MREMNNFWPLLAILFVSVFESVSIAFRLVIGRLGIRIGQFRLSEMALNELRAMHLASSGSMLLVGDISFGRESFSYRPKAFKYLVGVDGKVDVLLRFWLLFFPLIFIGLDLISVFIMASMLVVGIFLDVRNIMHAKQVGPKETKEGGGN